MSKERFELGLKIRKEVAGDAFVERAMGKTDAFDRDFQEMVTEYCWGGWGREGLSKAQRSLLNLGMLAALNRGEEFKTHFRGALNNGLSLLELREALMHIAIYCGIPAGVGAFRLARQVLEEEGIDVEQAFNQA